VRLARVNGDGTVIILGQLRDYYVTFDVGPHWITGWSRSPFAFDLRSGELLRVSRRTNGEGLAPAVIGASENVVAVAWMDGSAGEDGSLRVRVYQRSEMR
jgi:hypothetical protein